MRRATGCLLRAAHKLPWSVIDIRNRALSCCAASTPNSATWSGCRLRGASASCTCVACSTRLHGRLWIMRRAPCDCCWWILTGVARCVWVAHVWGMRCVASCSPAAGEQDFAIQVFYTDATNALSVSLVKRVVHVDNASSAAQSHGHPRFSPHGSSAASSRRAAMLAAWTTLSLGERRLIGRLVNTLLGWVWSRASSSRIAPR